MFGKKKPVEYVSVGPLVDGLPLPSTTPIIAKLEPEGFQITALTGRDKTTWPVFTLPLEKVTGVQIMDERQIQQVIQQSAPGMILGAAAFGAVGALIGGRVQTKERVKVSRLLVIDYNSSGPKQLVLNVSDNLKDSEQVVERFKALKPKGFQPVEL